MNCCTGGVGSSTTGSGSTTAGTTLGDLAGGEAGGVRVGAACLGGEDRGVALGVGSGVSTWYTLGLGWNKNHKISNC